MIGAANLATLMNSSMGSGAVQAVASHQGASSRAMSSEQIDKVSKDFESMFVSQMLEPMFGDSLGTDAFGDQESGDIYKSMMTDAYGKEISKAGGIGIADYVKKELLKLQEVHHG